MKKVKNKYRDLVGLELLKHSMISKLLLKWKVILAVSVLFAVCGGLIGLLPSQKYQAEILIEPSKKLNIIGDLGSAESSYILDSAVLLEYIRNIEVNVDDVNQICSIKERGGIDLNNNILKVKADIVKTSPIFIKFTLSGESAALLKNCMQVILSDIKKFEEIISNELIEKINTTVDENDYLLRKIRLNFNNVQKVDYGYAEEIRILLNANYAAKVSAKFIINNQTRSVSSLKVLPIPRKINKIILIYFFLGFVISFFIVCREDIRMYYKFLLTDLFD